jgi:TPR repeat protein
LGAQLMEEAMQWYQRGAEGGHGGAQHTLALCYAKGDGVHQSWPSATRWFEAAAAQVAPNKKKTLPFGDASSRASHVPRVWP